MEPKYYHHLVGANFRMDAIQAAVLRVKAPHLAGVDRGPAGECRPVPGAVSRRRPDAAVTLPVERPDCVHIFNQFVIRVADRDALSGISTRRASAPRSTIPCRSTCSRASQYLGYRRGDFPQAEAAARDSLAIPILRRAHGRAAGRSRRRDRPLRARAGQDDKIACYHQSIMSKRAIITGITGQDGSYLAELLLSKGYEVIGTVRRSSAPNFWRIQHLLDRMTLKPADLLDQLSIIRLVDEVRPHEFYNLAAMSFVPASWDQPMLTGEFNAQGVTRVMETIRQVDPSIRVYQASSSEMFGKVREVPQTELTPFYPRSPYGVSKVFAPLHHGELSGELRPLRRVRDALQSRVAAPWPGIRHPQGHRRRRAHQARPDRHAVAGQSRRAARLGICRRLRAGDVADAAAGAAGRLRHRHRRQPFGSASWWSWLSSTRASTGSSTFDSIRR